MGVAPTARDDSRTVGNDISNGKGGRETDVPHLRLKEVSTVGFDIIGEVASLLPLVIELVCNPAA